MKKMLYVLKNYTLLQFWRNVLCTAITISSLILLILKTSIKIWSIIYLNLNLIFVKIIQYKMFLVLWKIRSSDESFHFNFLHRTSNNNSSWNRCLTVLANGHFKLNTTWLKSYRRSSWLCLPHVFLISN